MDSPEQRIRRQAAFCRREWGRLTEERRQALIERLEREGHPIGSHWIAVLRGEHPLSHWLSGTEADLPRWPGTPTPRQLFSSHPFSERTPWSTRRTSPGSSSMPPGS